MHFWGATVCVMFALAPTEAGNCIASADEDSVDWLMECDVTTYPDRLCSAQSDTGCNSVGSGTCCTLLNALQPTALTTPTSQSPGEIVIVLYDSNEALDTSAVRNFGRYGVRVAHLSQPFHGFGSKWVALKHALTTQLFHDNDILVVLDSRDVLLNMFSMSQFDQRVHILLGKYPGGVIFSTEGTCCVSALAANRTRYFKEDGSRLDRACKSGSGTCVAGSQNKNILKWAAASRARAPQNAATPFLNAGVSAGTARAFVSLLTAADLAVTEDDQAVFTVMWLSRQHNIVLDFDNVLATSSEWRSPQCDFDLEPTSDGNELVCTAHVCPLFIHFNGQDAACHDKVKQMLQIPGATLQRRRRVSYSLDTTCPGGVLLNFDLPTPGSTFMGQLANSSNETRIECAHMCLAHTDCAAFSFSYTTTLCSTHMLSNVTKASNSTLLFARLQECRATTTSTPPAADTIDTVSRIFFPGSSPTWAKSGFVDRCDTCTSVWFGVHTQQALARHSIRVWTAEQVTLLYGTLLYNASHGIVQSEDVRRVVAIPLADKTVFSTQDFANMLVMIELTGTYYNGFAQTIEDTIRSSFNANTPEIEGHRIVTRVKVYSRSAPQQPMAASGEADLGVPTYLIVSGVALVALAALLGLNSRTKKAIQPKPVPASKPLPPPSYHF